ncbi:OmpW family protein [Acetobacteraceae bacterium EV16G]|uniref:OmpW family protein n=1 Tax=Sorlinia euscelidii TaxID=3081148 RepID=A0ABU7TZW5_9PROT
MTFSIKSCLAAMTGSLLSAATFQVAHAQQAASSASQSYVNAPLTTSQVMAPKAAMSDHACGIFKTCSSTKIGFGKGDFIVRLSALGVLPQDMDSKVWLANKPISGHISTTNQVMPELTFMYFLTDNLSVDLIAASTRHEVAAQGTPLGKIDVGSAWVLPPTITFAWHFRPHKRFNPYIGVGGTLAWFHNMSPAGGVVQKLNVGFTGGPSVNAGFDYQLVGNWFFNFDVKQIFMRMHAWANDNGSPTFIKAHNALNPTLVAAGIEYRF